jgi:hypothetical protein
VEARGSGVQDNLWLYSKFKGSLDHVRACIIKNQKLVVIRTFISALRRLMQEKPEFEDSSSYIKNACGEGWRRVGAGGGAFHPVKVFLAEELSPALSVSYLFFFFFFFFSATGFLCFALAVLELIL